MNAVFGCASSLPADSPFGRLGEVFTAGYGQAAQWISAGDPGIQVGYIADGGAVVGSAADRDVSLVYLGAIHKPLPGWNEGSPLDSPSRTAHCLLSRYRERRMRFLDGVAGQFSVIVHDRKENACVLVSDPGGIHDLYCYEGGGILAFSSNAFSLAAALNDHIKVDRSFEDFFLVCGFLPGEATHYKGIRRLAPGTMLRWQRGACRRETVERTGPWGDGFPCLDFERATEEEAIGALYDAFMLAVEEQLPSSERVAVLLGGFDSALVAAALARLGKKVETFSFHYDEAQYNQPHTGALANYIAGEHTWIHITPQVMEDGLRTFANKFNQPTNWPNYVIQTEYLSSQIRKRGILHVYSGDGCDTVFLGYPNVHRRAMLYGALFRLPSFLLPILLFPARLKFLEYIIGRPYRVGVCLLRNLGRPDRLRGFITFRIFDEFSLSRLRRDLPPIARSSSDDILQSLTANLAALSPDRLAYLGKSYVSPNKSKMGGSSTSSGVTILSPYMHPGLGALARSLPDRLCRPEGKTPASVTGKYILMRMAEAKRLLPHEVIYQDKMAAVHSPIDEWYATVLRNTALEMLAGLPFDYDRDYVLNLLRPKWIENLYRRMDCSGHITSHEISLLATYASFCRGLKRG